MIAALLVAACGGGLAALQPHPPPPAPAAAGHVYVQSAAEPAFWVVDARTGEVARTLPAGTPAPDWRRLYRLAGGALDVIDPATGLRVETHPAPDWAQVVRTSSGGRWLVLAPAGPSDRLQVQDAAWASAPVNVALQGSFTFDGISEDGQRLYLLERLGGDHYHVRMYDLAHGALAPNVIVDKVDGSAEMSGIGLAGATTRSGQMQLTLYERPSAEGPAFVHALPIGQDLPVAFCIDLPGPSTGWAFAPAPDHQRFYAVNPAGGWVVELNGPSDVGVPDIRPRYIAPGGAGGAAVAVSPDGRTVYAGAGSGVTAIDVRSLTVRAKGLAGQAVTALAAAPDGGAVYAVSGSRLLRLDAHSLMPAGAVTLHGPAGAILRVT